MFRLTAASKSHFASICLYCCFLDTCLFDSCRPVAVVSQFINLITHTLHSQESTMAVDKGDAPEHINLKVLGQDNAVVQFKIKKHTPLKKLMNAYCERTGLAMATVRFRFDGQAISEADTPSSLEMEEGDTIEVYQQQTGGFELSDYYLLFFTI